MPRSNRPRNRRSGDGEPDDEGFDLGRVLFGRPREVTARDGRWNVQPISAGSATKHYTCPGCGLGIPPATSHLVAWRADGLMGAADDLAARRHWHNHCWAIR